MFPSHPAPPRHCQPGRAKLKLAEGITKASTQKIHPTRSGHYSLECKMHKYMHIYVHIMALCPQVVNSWIGRPRSEIRKSHLDLSKATTWKISAFSLTVLASMGWEFLTPKGGTVLPRKTAQIPLNFKLCFTWQITIREEEKSPG